MTVKQRIALAAAVLALVAVVVLLIWFMRKPKDVPDGVLVYKEAYMRMADMPCQGERLCHNR